MSAYVSLFSTKLSNWLGRTDISLLCSQ